MKITVLVPVMLGLVSGACLADLGNNVLCLDVDRARLPFCNKGAYPFYEPRAG